MTEQEKYDAALLAEACRRTGIDPRTIKPGNSFLRSGKTARMMQIAIGEIDPRRAAELRLEVPGGGLSVATIEECMSGGELSPASMQDLWEHDPTFVTARLKEREQKFEADKKWLEDESDRIRRAREGDAEVDRLNAKAAAEQEARAESLRRHNELQQRINQQQVQSARMAGRLN